MILKISYRVEAALSGNFFCFLVKPPGVSPDLLVRSFAGIGNARLWLDMQTAYELAQARSKETPSVEPLVAL